MNSFPCLQKRWENMKSKLQKDIDSYVRKYAKKHNITKEQALTHERVRNVIVRLREGEQEHDKTGHRKV